MISIVCPFYNEESIIEKSIQLMMENLKSLSGDWELIVVNDGSTDRSLKIVQSLVGKFPRLRVVGYEVNRGRGFALRTGVANAKGELVVTTEIDSSWGDDIVHKIVAEFEQKQDADIIIASPHLPGGGYKNVPFKRVFLSSMGNWLIRAGTSSHISMHTGMTRGYRREIFLNLPLDEEGKEIHLEIIQKAMLLGYRIYEIPAVLEWKDKKLVSEESKERKSSSKINKLIRTHLMFTFLAAPFRYMYVLSGFLLLGGGAFFFWAIYNLFNPEPSIFLAITSFFLILFAFLISALGTLSKQNLETQGELWRIRTLLNQLVFPHEKADK
ncbi:MAG: glycosyltransferase family 2 protein [Nitrospinae bacterium]|nr:glycosyltransferase family 2 protein [Nitrospinota bacterium]